MFPDLRGPLPNLEFTQWSKFNAFVTIPDEYVSGVPNLILFTLSDNLLVSIPNVSYFSKLEELYLQNNYIPHAHELAFSGMVALRIMSIANNRLDSMPQLNYTVSLEELYLETNMIPCVPQHTLADLRHLRILYLHSNQLQYLSDVSFIGVLEDVRLHNNCLTTVPDLYNLPLVTLTLAENPLVCNQSLCWIRMWPWFKVPIALDAITCGSPASFSGSVLMDVHPVLLHCYRGKMGFK